ncbi:hypothetical protein FACS1894178_9290 [Bacteroidia bacterium]|nr:hypothetical protein FACS1894178_9290 [Bacteroidia bacterium]
MKKIIILGLCFFTLSLNIFSQDSIQKEENQVLVNKKGKAILPVKGDWAVGINAVPFINFIGGMFSTGAGSPVLEFKDGAMFYGKYFLKDKLALRMGIGGNYFHENYSIRDTAMAGLYYAKGSRYNISLNFGIEKRFGKKRLQYYIGSDCAIRFSQAKSIAKYAQQFGIIFAKDNLGLNLILGLNIFAGVEYFIIPKCSIGAEFGWGVSGNHPFKGYIYTEKRVPHYDENGNLTTDLQIIDRDYHAPQSFKINNFSGNILLLYYF